ncbi:MAG: TolB family protein [Gemmatimonadota bacterium]
MLRNIRFVLTFLLAGMVLLTAAACDDGPTAPMVTPMTGHWFPAWRADGSEIALVRMGEMGGPDVIHALSLASGETRELITVPGAGYLDWNADGTHIALNIGMGPYVIDLANRRAIRLGVGGIGGAPSFSPANDDLIVFTLSGPANAPPELWLANFSSGHYRRIPLPTPRSQLFDPDWSPDGRWIVASSNGAGGRALLNRLFVTDTLGRDTSYITDGRRNAIQPAWSPRGDWIVYVEADPGEVGDLWLIRPNGRDKRLLARSATQPGWNPEGSEIVFSRRHDSVLSVWVTNLDGRQRQIFPKPVSQ